MWITQQAYRDLQNELIQARAVVVAETSANKALKETLNWMMLRLTAMEKERAVMLDKFLGVKIATPEFLPAVVLDPFASHPYDETMGFADIGDEAARKLGIEYDENDSIRYTK